MRKYKIMILIFLIAFAVATGAQIERDVILLEATFYENGTAPSIDRLELREEAKSSAFYETEEAYEIALSDGQSIIWRKPVPISFDIQFYEGVQGGEGNPESVSSTTRKIWVPVKMDAKKLIFYRNNTKLDEINLPLKLCDTEQECTKYCSDKGVVVECTCGDSVCQEHENAELCQEDCGVTEEVSESEGEGDEGFSLDNRMVYVLIGVFILGFIFVVLRSDL